MDKLKWDRTCMNLAYGVAEHATCLRRKVGAVISKDHRIIATGFNGAPEGINHCTECMRDTLNVPSGQRHELSMAVHAEMNAIIQCALNGVSPEGATIYVTVTPCSMCLKALINSRIKRIVIDSDSYPDDLTKKLLVESGIILEVLEKDLLPIPTTNTQLTDDYLLGKKKFSSTYVANQDINLPEYCKVQFYNDVTSFPVDDNQKPLEVGLFEECYVNGNGEILSIPTPYEPHKTTIDINKIQCNTTINLINKDDIRSQYRSSCHTINNAFMTEEDTKILNSLNKLK